MNNRLKSCIRLQRVIIIVKKVRSGEKTSGNNLVPSKGPGNEVAQETPGLILRGPLGDVLGL